MLRIFYRILIQYLWRVFRTSETFRWHNAKERDTIICQVNLHELKATALTLIHTHTRTLAHQFDYCDWNLSKEKMCMQHDGNGKQCAVCRMPLSNIDNNLYCEFEESEQMWVKVRLSCVARLQLKPIVVVTCSSHLDWRLFYYEICWGDFICTRFIRKSS